jgi:hypothetical protein
MTSREPSAAIKSGNKAAHAHPFFQALPGRSATVRANLLLENMLLTAIKAVNHSNKRYLRQAIPEEN